MKIQQAFTYIFKEKNATQKLLIAFAFGLPLFITSLLSSFITPTERVTSFGTKTYTYGSDLGSLALILGCLTLIAALIYAFGAYWYEYEAAKAVFEKRETKLMSEHKSEDVWQRPLKLFGLNFVYGMIIGVFVLCIVFCFSALFSVSIAGALGNATQSDPSAFFNVAGAGLSVICLGLCLLIPVFIFLTYYVLDPSKMRLFYTDSLGKGLDVGKNISLAVKNSSKVTQIFLVELLLLIVYCIVAGVIGLFIGALALLLGGGTFALIITGLLSIPFYIIGGYYGLFVRPNFVARYYKEIFEEKKD